MPIYEYVCSACGHRADILHGLHDAGPHFCPDCGAEGSMRKAFAPPAIHFKGSGWAKRDRRSTAASTSSKSDAGDGEGKTAAATSSGSSASEGDATSSPTTTKESTSSGSAGD